MDQRSSRYVTCTMGKLTQKPHKKVTHIQAKRPLGLLHMDLCGPMPVRSLGGAKYLYAIVDEYSKYVDAYTIKNKAETFECFKEYLNIYENELGSKIKRVRSDNGREFVNSEFEDLFRAKGIRHQKTIPYNPQSNGVAERTNRSILEKTRTMLIDAELPESFCHDGNTFEKLISNK